MILQEKCPKCFTGSLEKRDVGDITIIKCLMCGLRTETKSEFETTLIRLY